VYGQAAPLADVLVEKNGQLIDDFRPLRLQVGGFRRVVLHVK